MITTSPGVRPVRRLAAVTIAVALAGVSFGAEAQQSTRGALRDLRPIREYIKKSWTTLTRSNRDLPAAAPDPKFHDHRPGAPWPVYLPAGESRDRVETELKQVLAADDLKKIALRPLPPSGQA